MTHPTTNAPGGGVAAPSPTEGVRPTPTTQKETDMRKHNPTTPTFQILGDGTPNTSHGNADIWVEHGTVNLVLPDRFGRRTAMLNFTFDDAAQIADHLALVLDEEATR